MTNLIKSIVLVVGGMGGMVGGITLFVWSAITYPMITSIVAVVIIMSGMVVLVKLYLDTEDTVKKIDP